MAKTPANSELADAIAAAPPPSPPVSSVASAPPAAPKIAAAPLSLLEYLSREPRLARRPEMRHAFALACRRQGLNRATPGEFARQLDLLERG
jgi:hypothetical protein